MSNKKKFFYIYKTTNLINGKFYIGMHTTNNLEDGYMGSGYLLKKSIKKYGIQNFKVEILEFLDNSKSLIQREAELVTEDLIKDPLCLNLKPGGKGGWTLEQQRENAFKCNQRQKWLKETNPEYAAKRLKQQRECGSKNFKKAWEEGKIAAPNWTGRKHKLETIEKLKNKEKSFGEKNSQFNTMWITNGIDNKKISKKQNIPEGWRKGRVMKNGV